MGPEGGRHGPLEVPGSGYRSADNHRGSMENIPMRNLGNGQSSDGSASPRPELTRRKGPFVYREYVDISVMLALFLPCVILQPKLSQVCCTVVMS